MAWEFLLTDLYGNVHGELKGAEDRRVGLPHMRVPSASGRIPLENKLADTLLTTDCLLRCTRIDNRTFQRDLAFHGPIVSAEESSDGQKAGIAFTAAGPLWRMTKRIVAGTLLKSGVAFSGDLGAIAHQILTGVNGPSHTGIAPGTLTTSISGGITWVGPKNAAEAIAELHAGVGSFEYAVVPQLPGVIGSGGWPTIATMNIAPVVGVNRPDAIFEYGGGARSNVASYSRQVTRDGMLTRGHISVGGWPDAPIEGRDIITRDADTLASRGLFEEVVSDAGVSNDAIRTGIVDYHLLYRKNPRQVITFKPTLNATPSPFVHYNVGDSVRARATVGSLLRFDGTFRVWGISFDIDGNGNEAVELELVTP